MSENWVAKTSDKRLLWKLMLKYSFVDEPQQLFNGVEKIFATFNHIFLINY